MYSPTTGQCPERDTVEFSGLNGRSISYPLLPRLSDDLWKRGWGDCRSQRQWMMTEKRCTLDTTLLYVGTHGGCEHMYKTCIRSSKTNAQPEEGEAPYVPPTPMLRS